MYNMTSDASLIKPSFTFDYEICFCAYKANAEGRVTEILDD